MVVLPVYVHDVILLPPLESTKIAPKELIPCVLVSESFSSTP